MSEEKEVHRGEIRIGFHREPIILTTRRLKIGTSKNQQEVLLSDILEAYTKTESGFGGTWSKLIIRLKDGRELSYLIISEEQQGAEVLFQTTSEVFGNASMLNKSTQDRWVSAVKDAISEARSLKREQLNVVHEKVPVIDTLNVVYCRYCANPNPIHSAFCNKCGKKIG